MGRHSAPDDADDADDTAPVSAVALRERVEVVATPGRHSRPDDDVETDVDDAPTAEVEVTLAELIAEDDDTQRIPPVLDEPDVDGPVAGSVAEPRPSPHPSPRPAPEPGHAVLRGAAHNSAADLHLVRSHRGVLALCAAAVVLPFVVEIVVLVLLGTVDGHSVLVWLWAPLVVAGVLLGVTLDIAHRRYAAAAAAPPPVPAPAATSS